MQIEINRVYDIDTLLGWRAEVIRHVFGSEPDARLIEQNCDYYRRHISDGTHIALVATADGEEAGCGAICISDELPSPDNPSGRCAYLMNIYVREPFRNHGIAHSIVKALIEKARECRCDKIYLEATDSGRPIYTSLGFSDLRNMMIYSHPTSDE